MVRTEIRVIYGDTDEMGVVYYANYLRYFEAGRSEFLRALGLRYRDFRERFGVLLPVAEAAVRYLHPARYDDLVSVETTLSELTGARARFSYRIVRDDALLLARGTTLHACLDTRGKVKRLPEELVNCLKRSVERPSSEES